MTSVSQPNPAEAYERVVAQGMFVPWAEDLVARAAPEPGEAVLDLACGTGIVMRQLTHALGQQGKLVGLDINPAMLAVARSVVPTDAAKVEFHEGSGTDLPFEDASFDLVLCQQGLQFFPDHAKGLAEIRRVLKPGGRAAISVWRDLALQSLLVALDEVVSRHLSPGAFAPGAALADAGLLKEQAEKVGFTEVHLEQVGKTLEVADPDTFAPMMMQAAAAVLPAFAEMPPDDRAVLIGKMQADVMDAIQPLIINGRLSFSTSANVLTCAR